MLDFQVEWVQVHANTGPALTHVIERPLAHGDDPKGNVFSVAEVACVGRYWVPQTPLLTDLKTLDWKFTSSGKYVRVPLFAYRTQARSLAAIWGLGIQIGLAALDSFRQYVGSDQNPRSVVLTLGNDCIDLMAQNQQGFRCYAGVAIVVDE